VDVSSAGSAPLATRLRAPTCAQCGSSGQVDDWMPFIPDTADMTSTDLYLQSSTLESSQTQRPQLHERKSAARAFALLHVSL
jgi:hypothetical protein